MGREPGAGWRSRVDGDTIEPRQRDFVAPRTLAGSTMLGMNGAACRGLSTGQSRHRRLVPRRAIAGFVALAASTALIAVGPGSSFGAGSRERGPAGCRGRLLEKASGGSLTEELIFHGAGPETEVVRLCSATGGRRYKFPEGPEGYGYSFFFTGLTFAAGRMAALAWAWGSSEAPKLWVINLTTGKVPFKKVLPRDLANQENILVCKTVLRGDGSVAWTQLSPSGACEVIEHTSRGTKILDPMRKAEPASLTLTGTTLGWVEEGHAHTAVLR